MLFLFNVSYNKCLDDDGVCVCVYKRRDKGNGVTKDCAATTTKIGRVELTRTI